MLSSFTQRIVVHLVQFLEMLGQDLVVLVVDRGRDADVGGADVRARNGEVNLRDDDVGFLFRLGQRIADAALRHLEIDDLALAHLPGGAFTDPEQRQGAVGPDFPDRRGDLGAADFERDDDVA
jgi:hypothetical protein